jgi:uncharacterized membrane protein YozB (DUF420 family)
LNQLVEILPHVNASLNALASVLLVAGYVVIKRRPRPLSPFSAGSGQPLVGAEATHRNIMLTAFATSIVFLVCYLLYHYLLHATTGEHGKPFPTSHGPALRGLYYSILISHVLLAVAVPVLAVWTIYLGLTNQRLRHNHWAWWTFPIWLYVSVTGVIVYLMLYHL